MTTRLQTAEILGAWEVVGGDGVHEWWPQLHVFYDTECGGVWEVWTRSKGQGGGKWRFDSMDEVVFSESDGSFAASRGNRFALVREDSEVWLWSLTTTAGARKLQKVQMPEAFQGRLKS